MSQHLVYSRPGRKKGDPSDDRALFLRNYAVELIVAFTANVVAYDKTMKRRIESGKSASFPKLNTLSAEYHKIGNPIQGSEMIHDEVVISLDNALVSATTLPNIDEAMSSHDLRKHYAKAAGDSLSRTIERHVLTTGIQAARNESMLPNNIKGQTIIPDQAIPGKPTVHEIIAAITESVAEFATRGVPDSDLYCFVRPSLYYQLASNELILNKQIGGSGSISKGIINSIAGIPILLTPNLPTGIIDHEDNPLYNCDFTKTIALIMDKQAVGTVLLKDMNVDWQKDIKYQHDLMVTKIYIGHGILRPECALEIAVEETSDERMSMPFAPS
ncbi:MAG: hypothetical protein ABW127_09875 [Candidatus Thiodiazotropha endolucinida]